MKKCMDINIMAVINGTEIAVERMKKAGKAGQIINTASMGELKARKTESFIFMKFYFEFLFIHFHLQESSSLKYQ